MGKEREILGNCDERFAAVQDAFAASFGVQPAGGASLAVVVDGELVVDLWGGFADRAQERPWESDTIVRVHSTTKSLTASCAHLLVDRGQIDLEAPVADYWPEFAKAGKQSIPVHWLLSHRAGVVGLRNPLTGGDDFDCEAVVDALAAEEPWWEPGTRFGYHALSFNWLVGELVRRVSGRTIGQFFREELAEPLDLDACLNCVCVPEYCYAGSTSTAYRLADVIPPPPLPLPALGGRVSVYDERSRRSHAHMTSMHGHANARALARLFGALAQGGVIGGVEILRNKSTIEAMRTVDNEGVESAIDWNAGWMKRYALGYAVPSPFRPFSPNPRAFGHSGRGGSLAFADPEAGLGFGYAPGGLSWDTPVGDLRWPRMITAVYDALGVRAHPPSDPLGVRFVSAAD